MNKELEEKIKKLLTILPLGREIFMIEYKILFKPEGKEVRVKEGETILQAAHQV